MNGRSFSRPNQWMVLLVVGLGFLNLGQDTWAHQWLPMSGPQAEGRPFVSVTAADDQFVDLEVGVPGLYRETVTTPGGEFPRLSIPPEGHTVEIGRPQVPVMLRWVEIPAGAEVDLEVVSSEMQIIPLVELGIEDDIAPVQRPVPKVPGAQEAATFAKDDAFYAQDLWYPADVVQLGEIDQRRGHRLVSLKIYPVRYHPKRAQVSICTRLSLRLHLKGADLQETVRQQMRWRSPAFDRRMRRSVLNYDRYAAKDAPPLPIGYLIITDDNYYNQVLPLAQWKEQKGFEVTVTEVSQISPQTASGIKAYIQDAYQNWPVPPTYVLLVGDVGDIPAFSGSSSTTETDLPYGDMSGSYLPELEVGRFSVSSTAEAAAAVNKTLDYERTDLSTLAWFDDAVFMASSDHYYVTEETHNYVIENYLEPNGYTCYKIYQRLGGGTSQITSNLNAGRAIANYSGHGNQTSWAGPAFGIGNIDALTNADMYPFVISNACLTSDLGYGECYGEHWVNVTGKGGIAHWGSSNYTYWDEDDILEKRMYQAIFDDQLFTFAGFTDQAKWYTYQYYGGSGLSRYYYECYILLGDPSLELPTAIPVALTVTHPATVPLGLSKVIVNVTQGGSGIENALVCALQAGSVHQAAYSDSSGQAALYISPTTTDTILVTVTAHNYRPYQGTIVPVDNIPPAAVTDLSAHLANSALMLSWSAVTTDTLEHPKTVLGYAVYRETDPDFEPSVANSLATTSEPGYLDPGSAVGDTTAQHYYRVVALGDGGQKSEPSQAAGEFDRWASNVEPPAPPTK